MYWNCTSPSEGTGFKQEKLDFIKQVVQAIAPDILCLDEVSKRVHNQHDAKEFARNNLNGGVAYDRGKVSPNPGSHLNAVAWAKANVPATMAVGLPVKAWDSSATKRDTVSVKVRIGMNEAKIFFLHANASSFGGKTAVGLAHDNVDNSWNVFIGDFNCPINKARRATAPAVNGHNFTQWKRDDFGSKTVPNRQPPMKYNPHYIIDYAIAETANITLTAVDAVRAFPLHEFIGQFDHFPVAYDLT
jgi:endonuclease/exonuclease/phosphatase family metal-dependent hydrolase